MMLSGFGVGFRGGGCNCARNPVRRLLLRSPAQATRQPPSDLTKRCIRPTQILRSRSVIVRAIDADDTDDADDVGGEADEGEDEGEVPVEDPDIIETESVELEAVEVVGDEIVAAEIVGDEIVGEVEFDGDLDLGDEDRELLKGNLQEGGDEFERFERARMADQFASQQKEIPEEQEWYYADVAREEHQLAEILHFAGYEELAEKVRENFGDFKISGVQSDLSLIQKGDLFFAEGTEYYDTFEYIPEAMRRGAVGVACEYREDEPDRQEELAVFVEPLLFFPDIQEAMARIGCVFYGHPTKDMNVVGVTGSTGKTTVSWLIRAIFFQHKRSTGIICDTEHAMLNDHLDSDGNIWKTNEPDVAKTREATTPYHITEYTGRYWVEKTIPNALQTQKLLGGMADRGAKACVIECPSVYLMQAHLKYINYTLAVFTNLSPHDMGKEASFEQHTSAMANLFQDLDDPRRQRAIINLDDEHAEEFIQHASKVPVVTYALNGGADVYSLTVKYTIWDTEILIHTPVGKIRVVTALLGEANVMNVLAAVAAGISINIPLKEILDGLEAVEAVPGRGEVIDEGQEPEFSVVVDNAQTPKRLEQLLDNIRNCGVKRILLVLGCKGCENQELRSQMGKVAHFKADTVFFTNDSPRFDSPNSVIDDMILGIPEEVRDRYALWVFNPFQDPGRVPWWFDEYLRAAQKQTRRYVVEDRSLAIRSAIGTAQEGDVVVIAGRGDEDFQEFDDGSGEDLLKGWFDDRAEARDALRKLPYLEKANLDRKEIPWQRQ
ncbi:hypothetical protein BSKO_11332 [Bryopsis sp. KO-2023]|nr:hypothetical protein BSKO_11332 [Bryopsis sp. KO-2023]